MSFFFHTSWNILNRLSVIHSNCKYFTIIQLFNCYFSFYKCEWANLICNIYLVVKLYFCHALSLLFDSYRHFVC